MEIFHKNVYQLNSKIENTIFLAGTGRSGTTWVSELINAENSYRYMFEPFHSKYVQEWTEFKYRQYIRPESKDQKYLHAVEQILKGNIRNPWVDKFNKKKWVRKRLLKDIRANLFLKWLKVNWPELTIILLIRHPFAVASSKIKLNWEAPLEDFLDQEELMQDYLAPFETLIRSPLSDFEKHVLVWCIENYIPLKQFQNDQIHIVLYERLISNPLVEIQRLEALLKHKFDPEIVKQKLNKASALSRKDSAIMTGSNLLDSWSLHTGEEQLNKGQQILQAFGFDKLYDLQAMPLSDNPWVAIK